jgi:hypothetical protein
MVKASQEKYLEIKVMGRTLMDHDDESFKELPEMKILMILHQHCSHFI